MTKDERKIGDFFMRYLVTFTLNDGNMVIDCDTFNEVFGKIVTEKNLSKNTGVVRSYIIPVDRVVEIKEIEK